MTSPTPDADLVEPLLEETVEVSAPIERVWALVSDLPRMASWSPQVVKTFLRGGRPVRLGTTMVNVNRRGLLVWPTNSRVVRFEPPRQVAFKVKENGTIWSISLEPTPEGTRIVQRREAPHGISALSKRLTDRLLGGQETFQAELRLGMQQTLALIKAEAERA